MKKFLITAVIFSIFWGNIPVFSAENNSDNTFDITISDIPPGGPANTKGSKGLSDGAVTAIALGSVFGGLAALGGGAYYFYQKGLKPVCGCMLGKDCPYQTVCYDSKFLAKLKENPSKFKHLTKSIENENIAGSGAKKYVFLPDTSIKGKTFNRVYIENPYQNKPVNVKIIQYSSPFSTDKKIPSLNTLLFAEEKEIPLTAQKIEKENGILIKTGQILPDKGKKIFVDTILSDVQKSADYSLIIEFDT